MLQPTDISFSLIFKWVQNKLCSPVRDTVTSLFMSCIVPWNGISLNFECLHFEERTRFRGLKPCLWNLKCSDCGQCWFDMESRLKVEVFWDVTLCHGWVVPQTSKDCSASMFRVKHSFHLLEMLDLADEVTILLQNIKNYSPSDTVSHHRRLKLQQHCCWKLQSHRKQVVWLSLVIRVMCLQFSESSKIYSGSAMSGDSYTSAFQRLTLSPLSGFWYDDTQSDHCNRTWANGTSGWSR